jgi:branched-chain amino acid transport system permease protein
MTAKAISSAATSQKGSGFLTRLANPRVYCALLALSLILIVPAVIDSPFVVHVFVTICVFAALSTAWNIVGGYAGQLSLGHTVFYGIGGYTTALLSASASVIRVSVCGARSSLWRRSPFLRWCAFSPSTSLA